MRKFGLELWPGYKTSIRQHESNILMCVEITHKVMRMETAYDILQDIHRRSRDDHRVSPLFPCILFYGLVFKLLFHFFLCVFYRGILLKKLWVV